MRRYLVPAICIILTSINIRAARAQDNPYKIDNSLYPYFERARINSDSLIALDIADTLRRKAIELGDKKAECLAYTIAVSYYYKKGDAEALTTAVDSLKSVSRRNDYLQYYYHGWNQKIVHLLNTGHSLEALEENEMMKTQALTDNHPFGIYTCLRNQGHIQKNRQNYKLAVENYIEALNYMLSHLPDQDPTRNYLDIADYYSLADKTQLLALEYINKGIKSSRTETNLITCKAHKAVLMAKMGNKTEFYRLFNEVSHSKYNKPVALGLVTYKNLHFEKALLENDYERAMQIIGTTVYDNIDRYALMARIARKTNDFKSADHYQTRSNELRDSLQQQIQAEDIALLNARLGKERLEQENTKLDLENSQLELEKLHQTYMLTTIITVMLIAILIMLAYYTYRKRLSEQRLKLKNEELKEAHEQIKAADHMKTLFIRNMSHEIRTPLNSIVGFAQIITDDDFDLTSNERKEYTNLIDKNSKLLTKQVNDLLSLAELESGHLTLHKEACKVNSLCNESIATVSQGVPEGVKLYYTSEADDNFTINTDGARVRQVLINFLTNAEKYTSKGEIRLHCSLCEHPEHVTFAVTDTGCGIPPEKAEHIFERFNKLDEYTQGFGVGLHISRLIAEMLHAEIRLDTSYTGGARFLLIL